MNTDDLNFAYKVRHALNEQLDHLPAATVDRLAAARQLALSRKKAAAAPAPRHRLAARIGRFFAHPPAWAPRLSVAVPLLAMVVGLFNVYHLERQQRVVELAELDAAVLSDELPLSAYLDHGFNVYLEKHAQ